MKLLDLDTLSKLPPDQQIEIKKGIIETNALEDIPIAYLPDVHTSDYYFVSYSHLDYVDVYCDIFELQSNGLSIWYDRGIPAGRNWKDTASKYLTPIACRGVIFYLSDNSLLSDSILVELEYAIKANKTIIAINLPLEKDYIYQGQNVKGKIFSVSEMIDILIANNKDFSKEKIERLKAIFPSELIYLPLSMHCSTRIEKIKSGTVLKLLLKGHVEKNKRKDVVVIDSTNDTTLVKINEQDFYDLFKSLGVSQLEQIYIKIGSCCFANCSLLEEIDVPSNVKVLAVGDYAFFNDRSFIGFTKSTTIYKYIGRGAFGNCASLKEITTPYVIEYVGEEAFMNCTQLSEINNSSYDYVSDGYKSTYDVFYIGPRTFLKCAKLKDFKIWFNAVGIEGRAFAGCTNLENISIDKKLKEIKEYAFVGCNKLTNISVDSKNQNLSVHNNMVFENEKRIMTKLLFYFNKESVKCIKLTKTINAISEEALKYPPKQAYFDVHPDNKTFASYHGSLYSKNFSLLILYNPSSTENYPLDLHPNTKTIGENSLANNMFTRIKFPSFIENLRTGAFNYCQDLREVYIPQSIIHVGRDTFDFYGPAIIYTEHKMIPESWDSDWSFTVHQPAIVFDFSMDDEPIVQNNIHYSIKDDNIAILVGSSIDLELLTIPEEITYNDKKYKVASIGPSAFAAQSLLEKVSISDNVETIESGAFSHCHNLKTIFFGKGLKMVMGNAFEYCDKLEELLFPDQVELKGWHNLFSTRDDEDEISFTALESLKRIVLPSCDYGNKRIEFRSCSSLVEITFPDSLETINTLDFMRCLSLVSITLPNSLKEIKKYISIHECPKFEKIIFKGTMKEWSKIKTNNKNYIMNSGGDYTYLPVKIECLDGVIKLK